jgi:hypothetical protein
MTTINMNPMNPEKYNLGMITTIVEGCVVETRPRTIEDCPLKARDPPVVSYWMRQARGQPTVEKRHRY